MRLREERGQGLVEFALVLPLIILLLFAIFDLGRAVYAYSTIGNAARAGSRVAIVDQTTATIEQEAIDQGVAIGITPTDIDICFITAGSSAQSCTNPTPPVAEMCGSPRSIGCIAVVSVRHSFTAVTPLIDRIVGSINMESTTRLQLERVFP